jgi:hypothetical protein
MRSISDYGVQLTLAASPINGTTKQPSNKGGMPRRKFYARQRVFSRYSSFMVEDKLWAKDRLQSQSPFIY